VRLLELGSRTMAFAPPPQIPLVVDVNRLSTHQPGRGRGLTSFARTIATFVNSVDSLMLAAHSCPTSESPFDSSAYVIAQFLRSLQCSLDPHNLQFARRHLSSRFTVTSCCGQTALVTGEHASKDRHCTFLRAPGRGQSCIDTGTDQMLLAAPAACPMAWQCVSVQIGLPARLPGACRANVRGHKGIQPQLKII
jgi:hypothetical protein